LTIAGTLAAYIPARRARAGLTRYSRSEASKGVSFLRPGVSVVITASPAYGSTKPNRIA
jgi:phosphoenolpyruvate carboxylase